MFTNFGGINRTKMYMQTNISVLHYWMIIECWNKTELNILDGIAVFWGQNMLYIYVCVYIDMCIYIYWRYVYIIYIYIHLPLRGRTKTYLCCVRPRWCCNMTTLHWDEYFGSSNYHAMFVCPLVIKHGHGPSLIYIYIYMEVSWNGGTPSHHPF